VALGGGAGGRGVDGGDASPHNFSSSYWFVSAFAFDNSGMEFFTSDVASLG
jgi:hypothetical protein